LKPQTIVLFDILFSKENNGKNNFKLKNHRVYFYGFKKVVDI